MLRAIARIVGWHGILIDACHMQCTSRSERDREQDDRELHLRLPLGVQLGTPDSEGSRQLHVRRTVSFTRAPPRTCTARAANAVSSLDVRAAADREERRGGAEAGQRTQERREVAEFACETRARRYHVHALRVYAAHAIAPRFAVALKVTRVPDAKVRLHTVEPAS